MDAMKRPSIPPCPYCKRTFSRREHIQRHIRSHENKKPYTCEACQRSFGRNDVYRRHLRTQHPELQPSQASRNRKIEVACDNCHQRKLKCNLFQQPCQRCVERGLDCTFQRKSSALSHEISQASPESSLSNHDGLDSMSNRLLSSDARTLDGCLQSPDNQIRLAHTDLDIPCPSRDAFVPETMLNLFDTDIPSLFDFGVLEELHVVPEFNLATGTLTEGPFTPLLEQVPGERQSANDPTPDTHSHTWDYYPHCIERIDNSYPTPSVSSQSARLTGAYAKLYEYSSPEEDSRPQSPSVRDEYDKWLERLGMNAQLQCDPAVLEIMINLFRIRLSPTFRCFENFTICETTPTELFVAMAAVGCLYCKANDSMMVAKWLFNHARVVLLSKVHHQRALCKDEDGLAILQTYMILELFGYLGGDNRSHEIAEVYHWEMVQLIEAYDLWCPMDRTSESDRRRTLEGVQILECYRVTFLQSPITFTLSTLLANLPKSIISPETGSSKPPLPTGLFETIPGCGTCEGSVDSGCQEATLGNLCYLSLLLETGTAAKNQNSSRRHRAEFIEMMLEEWSRSGNRLIQGPTMLLFHMISLGLHVNLNRIQNIARHPYAITIGLSQSKLTQPPEEILNSGSDRIKAIWHATRIIQLGEEQRQKTGETSPRIEAPHLTYCIFFAALTLWYFENLSSSKLCPPSAHSTTFAVAVNVLSASTARVAKKFLYTLQSISHYPIKTGNLENGFFVDDGYRPERYDSILASAEISKQTLETFKQNVLTEHKGFVGSCNYVQYQFPSLGDVPTHAKCMDLLANDSFHIDNETWRMQEPLEVGSEPSLPEEETKFSTMGRSQLPYPLSLFDSFPKVPSSIDLDRLIHICDIEFISQTPFLSASHLSLTSHKFAPSSYLIFAKALMATLVSRDAGHRHWARSLYHAASKLFVAAVELDNRISRSLSWYQAGMFLVTYGMLQSDGDIWRTINMINGYFFAPYKRSGLLNILKGKSIIRTSSSPDPLDLSRLTSYYFMVDILRAIHLHTPTVLTASDLSIPLWSVPELHFQSLYLSINNDHHMLPSTLNADEYLLLLLAILSDTVSMLLTLGLLANPSAPTLNQLMEHNLSNISEVEELSCLPTNPFLPFSASNEYAQRSESLICSLEAWIASVQQIPRAVGTNTDRHTHHGILPLAYFCRILLEIGPKVLMLPQMAGYGTATSNDHTNTGPSNPKHKISPDWSIHVSDTAVDCAWKVLDAIDHENEGEKSGEANNATSDQDTNSCLISLWLPLVVFYSGLTVWARFCEDQSSGNSGIHSYPKASRKVLGLFHRELKHMGRQYECASRMAAVLEKL